LQLANKLGKPFSDDSQENYLKVAQVYYDVDIHSHFIKEVRQEDRGFHHIGNK
jgi:hypothetical protein